MRFAPTLLLCVLSTLVGLGLAQPRAAPAPLRPETTSTICRALALFDAENVLADLRVEVARKHPNPARIASLTRQATRVFAWLALFGCGPKHFEEGRAPAFLVTPLEERVEQDVRAAIAELRPVLEARGPIHPPSSHTCYALRLASTAKGKTDMGAAIPIAQLGISMGCDLDEAVPADPAWREQWP